MRRSRIGAISAAVLLCLLCLLASPPAALAATPAPPLTVRVEVPSMDSLAPSPPGFVAPPDLSRSSPRAELVAFEARGTSLRGGVTTCVATEATGWVEEAAPIAMERIAAMAAASVARAHGLPPRWHGEVRRARGSDESPGYREALSPDLGESTSGALFLGFAGAGGHTALACWAVCFGQGSCDATQARFVGPFVPPPPPGLGLRALVLAVHRPRMAGALTLLLGVGVAMVYVRSRPRPKVR